MCEWKFIEIGQNIFKNVLLKNTYIAYLYYAMYVFILSCNNFVSFLIAQMQ